MRKLSNIIASLALVIGGHGSYAIAQTTTLDFNYLFKTGGSESRLTATFEAISGGVQLTMSTLWSGNEFVKDIYFNTSITAPLTFTYVSGNATTVNPSVGNYQADGAGYYDIKFSYPTPANADRFKGSETSIYSITGSGVVPASFWSLASGPSTYGPFFAVAQTTHTDAWVAAIPEPQIFAMMLAGLGLMVMIARRRKRSLDSAPA